VTIDHTEVSDELKGKGAGKQLIAAVVEYVRKNNLKVLPLCTFAKSVFERVPEFQDVLQRK
jgi:predicted GNAT family acetyltransferase